MNALRLFVATCFVLLATRMSCTDVLQIENQIQSFYKGYMEAINTNNDEQLMQLIQRFLTPEMREKRSRLNCATDADEMIRAQDVSDYVSQSVRCKHLEGNWYEISYRFYPQDSLEYIPLRVTGDGEQVRISYVTPYWGGRKYGDELFDIDKVEVDDRQDAKTFVETFYKSYAYYYVKMVPDKEMGRTFIRSGHREG